MVEIQLAAVPNQSFTMNLSGSRWVLTLKACTGCMAVSASRDDVVLFENIRTVAGEPLIPYSYLSDGNFLITTENDDLPDWTQFGVTQFLVYATAAEIAANG